MVPICPIPILLLLLLMLLGLKSMRRVLLGLLVQLWLVLSLYIVRHGLHLRHLMVRLRHELVVCLVLLIAHVCHRVPVSILRLLEALLLHGRHLLRKAIVGRPVGLRAPVVVVHRDDIGSRGAALSTLPTAARNLHWSFPSTLSDLLF